MYYLYIFNIFNHLNIRYNTKITKMNNFTFKLLIISSFFITSLFSQNERKFKIHTLAFYNVENLFDTINDPNKNDEASPMMEINYNRGGIYKQKVKNMARVISDIGKENTQRHPAIVGLSEVENKQVIVDLINDSSLSEKNYNIIHYDSPDKRGIDVAMIYDENVFKPFYKIDKGRADSKSSVGLGLSIASDIIRSHGGNINLEKSKMNGLRVKIFLPI